MAYEKAAKMLAHFSNIFVRSVRKYVYNMAITFFTTRYKMLFL